jgi:hypothetical protein
MRHVIYFTISVLVALSGSGRAQGLSSPPGDGTVVGGAGGLAPPPRSPLLIGENAGARRHMGPTGKACLTVNGEAQRETINPNLFEHMVIAQNDCSQRIKMQVCYYQSQQCVAMNVPPYGRQDLVLGIMPAMNEFRFEFREQFDQF